MLSAGSRSWLPLVAILACSCTGLSYYEPGEDKSTGDLANVDDAGDEPGDDDDETDDPGPETEGDDDDTTGDDDDVTGDDDDDTTTDSTDGDDDDDDDDTVPPPPLSLDSLTPAFGTTAGGTRVTLQGEFSAGVEVRFDGQLANVISQDATEMEVETPAVGAEGWVDVEVSLGSDSHSLNSAYQYWQDGSGQSGTFGFMMYVEFVGGYWSPVPSPVAQGMVGFTEPGTWELWQDYTTALDTCVYNFVPSGLPIVYNPGSSYVDLDNGGSITRLGDASAVFGAGYYGSQTLIPNVEVVPGASYDLLTVPGNANWPAFSMNDFVEVPGSFNVTQPDLDRANPPIVQQQIDFAWGGGGGDYMLIYILRQYWTGAAWLDDGVITCAVYDDGAFTLPAATWPTWFAGDFLHVQVGRVYESSDVLPYNDAENRMTGIYWFYGGADTVL
jgi:hypothetical protein